jgi:hypothetical protein
MEAFTEAEIVAGDALWQAASNDRVNPASRRSLKSTRLLGLKSHGAKILISAPESDR